MSVMACLQQLTCSGGSFKNDSSGPLMKIEELRHLPNWVSTAVDNETGHAIAIVRAADGGYLLYDGNSMTMPYSTQIEHPQGRSSYSIDEMRQMFATRKLSGLEGFLER